MWKTCGDASESRELRAFVVDARRACCFVAGEFPVHYGGGSDLRDNFATSGQRFRLTWASGL